MLKAKQVQEMIGAADYDDVASGYTYNRETVEIFFEDGKIHRHTLVADPLAHPRTWKHESSEDFEPDYFLVNVKRFYRNQTFTKLNELFLTFGTGLPLTGPEHASGQYPPLVKETQSA